MCFSGMSVAPYECGSVAWTTTQFHRSNLTALDAICDILIIMAIGNHLIIIYACLSHIVLSLRRGVAESVLPISA